MMMMDDEIEIEMKNENEKIKNLISFRTQKKKKLKKIKKIYNLQLCQLLNNLKLFCMSTIWVVACALLCLEAWLAKYICFFFFRFKK